MSIDQSAPGGLCRAITNEEAALVGYASDFRDPDGNAMYIRETGGRGQDLRRVGAISHCIVCGMVGAGGVLAFGHIHMRDLHLSPEGDEQRVFRLCWHHHHGCCDQGYFSTIDLAGQGRNARDIAWMTEAISGELERHCVLLYVAPEVLLIGFAGMLLSLFLRGGAAIDPSTYATGIRALFTPDQRPRAKAVMGEGGDGRGRHRIAWLAGGAVLLHGGDRPADRARPPGAERAAGGGAGTARGLVDDAIAALWVVLLYIGVQRIEGNVTTTPLIQQHTIQTPPALIIAMQFLLGILFSLLGPALAVPIIAAGVTLIRMLYVEGYVEPKPVAAG